MPVPKFDELMNPTLRALRQLGGSGSIKEIEDAVAKLLQLSDRDMSETHRGNLTKFEYRLAWARNYLKRFGLLENSIRGVWALTPKGAQITEVDRAEVKRFVRGVSRVSPQAGAVDEEHEPEEEHTWEQELLEKILSLDPAAFERLCQRILRESGFTQVEVTGRSGDGGIDGPGVVRIGGLLSFRVIFQCKRYARSVGPSEVRDFRGAMVGRADKGLLITTGRFTKDAWQEATRDGAPPVDLIDGEQLVLKMKELGLGVIRREEAVVDETWFERFQTSK